MPFDTDERLPTMPAVLAQFPDWQVVRYLPRRRCTLRQEKRYLKVYPDDRGQRADCSGRTLWCAQHLAFNVPTPEGWDPATRTLSQQALSGIPVAHALYGPPGAGTARRIGHANASLAQSSLHFHHVFDASAELRQSLSIGTELIPRVPSLAPTIGQLLQSLGTIHATFPSRALRPIHGDPHAAQWLDDGEQLGLLDFESTAMGDPELDAAVFLAELDFEAELQLPVAQLEAAYLTGAQSAGLLFDPDRLRAYRGHKRLAKALRSARAVRPDGDARAAVHLGRALECVIQ